MGTVDTLIKWPGGKTREIKHIKSIIPRFDRYIEPFFGGGAMFFYLQPQRALINDISADLMSFYKMVKEQNSMLYHYLCSYDGLLTSLLIIAETNYNEICSMYYAAKYNSINYKNLEHNLNTLIDKMIAGIHSSYIISLVLSIEELKKHLFHNSLDKIVRTIENEKKAEYSKDDLKENLITGFTSGLYMYFRSIYNDILLSRIKSPNSEYSIANFYFIREYCYGSMFRYNGKGEFNIPYGGMSYNKKCLKSKIDVIFSEKTESIFKRTDLYCKDFEDFLTSIELNKNDFMFLDPPYDTDFSDYEGKPFDRHDQKRLADFLKNTAAQFILIIKNTDYIYSLYGDSFKVQGFEKSYTYNVRSRNDRNTEHLIITNIQ